MTKPRVRFAPSPTGYLHIGGVRTALFNWLWARKTGGTFVLRIEDTDQERSTEASRAVIIEALQWAGLDWDEGPSVDGDRGNYGPYTQMQRLALYAQVADQLIAAGKAYRCYCTKTELEAQRAALKQRDPSAGFKYPGTCRTRTDQPDLPFVIRLKTDRSGAVTYVDKVFGRIETPNTEMQDFILVRSDGVPLYNFGAVVDDTMMEITLVARGRDHMINTPPQILIFEALDAKVPEFAHLPMMLAPNGERLSKRHGAVSVTEYRDNGYSPDAVLDYLARFGWSSGEHEVRLRRDELVAAFDWSQCGRGDGKFDPKKFQAINFDHLKSARLTPAPIYVECVQPFVQARGLDAPVTAAAIATIRDRAQTFVQAADMLDPYLREPPSLGEAARKLLTPEAVERVHGLGSALTSVSDWSESALEARATAWLVEQGLELKALGQALRVALMGRTASPGLFEVMHVLGRDRTLARLARVTA